MSRLIDADKLWKHKFKSASERMDLDVVYMGGWNDAIDSIVENAPTVDAEPTRHGHWIDHTYKYRYPVGRYECSICGAAHDMEWDYCPNCGARMDERREDERK